MVDGSNSKAPIERASDHLAEMAEKIEHAVVDVVQPVTEDVAESAAAWLRLQPWMLSLTRAGWVAKALVYASLGWASIVLAVQWTAPVASDSDVTYTGIVALLAEQTWSRLVLLVVALGLVLYLAFRLGSILLIDSGGFNGMAHRTGYAFSAATYAMIAWAAFIAAVSGNHQDGGSTLERYSAELLSTAIGRIAVGIGALGALGLAGYFVAKGLSLRFARQLDLGEVGASHRRFLMVAGAVGWVGRAIVVAAVAIFLLWAAIQADPQDARGLDRALHRVAFQSTLGTLVVGATGVLLIAYAVFCFASTPYRSLAWSDRNDPNRGFHHPTTATNPQRNKTEERP